MKKPKLGLVIPCFNEEEVLNESIIRLINLLDVMIEAQIVHEDSTINFVDDGSTDSTWDLINTSIEKNKNINGIKLSANRGHQNALVCGLLTAPGDILISADADLQDDLSIIPEMIALYKKGNEIVYGVRRKRDTDTIFKRYSAEIFYILMKKLGVNIIFNHADFRLMSRKTVDNLKEYNEVNLFLRGIVRLVGYKSSIIEYDRLKRFSGESKYPFFKMLGFAIEGVTSFSIIPLRMISVAGLFILLINIALTCWALIDKIIFNAVIPGWTSTVVPIYFIGGVQLLFMGVIGEYVGKIYLETKARPRYHIEKKIGQSFLGETGSFEAH